jgi:hypothetical protein
MSALAKPKESDKWERVRCLRYGDFLRLFRDRYHSKGYLHFPDDSAGRDDLWLLVNNTSMAAVEPKKKMRHVIELWAPWIPDNEVGPYIEHVWGLDFYQRLMTAREIGERLGLTNAERERLKLWQFKPIDMTDEELTAHRKRKNNERRRAKRARTRAEYLGSCLSATKPWEAEGISRSAWERRRKNASTRGRSAPENASTRGRNNSVYGSAVSCGVKERGESARGLQEGGAPVGRAASNESRDMDRHTPRSYAQRPRLAASKGDLARVAAVMRDRAMEEWRNRGLKKFGSKIEGESDA